MTTKHLSLTVPFSGFYNSIWSEALRFYEEMVVNGLVVEEEDRDAVFGALCDATEYQTAHSDVAKEYVAQFNHAFEAKTEIEINLRFETLASPREYNYTTDRIFAHIPVGRAHALFALSRNENHDSLRALVERDFTHRDGFVSHYSNDLDDWLEAPLAEWSPVQVGALLQAMAGDDAEAAIFDIMQSKGLTERIFENSVNWALLEL